MTEKTYKAQSLWRLLRLLKPKHWKYIGGLFGRVAITTSERVFIAILLKWLVDAVIAGDKPGFASTMIVWVAFYLSLTLIAPFVLYIWRSAVFEGTANIREAVFKHLNRLPLGYHELHHSGDALSILTNDVSTAEKAYQEDLYTLVEASVQGISGAVAMLFLNWQLSLIILASGLAPLLVNTLFAGPLRKVGQEVQSRLGALSERMSDLLAGFQVIRTYTLGDWILTRFGQANERVLEGSLKRVRLDAALSASNEFAGIFFLLPLLVGAYMVINQETTIGTYLALVQLSNNINYFVYSIGGVISRIQSALAASDRILELLDAAVEPERYPLQTGALARAPQVAKDALIQFDQVTFGYNGDQNILNSISFSIQRGQFAAFAGPSGGGKSTLLKLLLGCYPVKDGAIYVSGRSIPEYRLADLRDHFAYVPQDAYLFSGTILENIRYGKPGAGEGEIQAAAQAAFAHEFISEFPSGYQTVVGERGARLSGGQRQRIAIARALLKDAPILLLDEATSALDSESEQIVQRALEVLMRGRTTLVIAHRFSTILLADPIYVMDEGRIAEQGSHEDLIAARGLYARLYDQQFKLSKPEEPASSLGTSLSFQT